MELTQAEVAERLQVKRPTIAQIEAGNRAVSSIELSQFAIIYKRDIDYFLADEQANRLPGIVHLRASADLGDPVDTLLQKCVELCEAATWLEKELDTPKEVVPFSYNLDRPQTRWEAVEQGLKLAAMERKRLDIGDAPVRNIVEIIARHGVRVGRDSLTDDISGIFFVGPDTGPAILVNSGHHITRRLFSYAHEYAHLLVDSSHVPGGVSRYGNRGDLIEVRANAFAAHFLMPSDGVFAFLSRMKQPSRQVVEIYDGFKNPESDESGALTAQRKHSTPYEIKMIDVVRVAHFFGTSYEATLYQFLNLKILNKESFNALMDVRDKAERASELLGMPKHLEMEEFSDLKRVVTNLIIEAWLSKKIARPKAYELIKKVDKTPEDLEALDDPE